MCCNGGQPDAAPVIDIARRSVLRIGEPRAVRRRVIGIARREVPLRQERILRGRLREPPHVVKRELIGARGVRHLDQARVVIVGIIHGRIIRIGLLQQPVQLVVSSRPVKSMT